MMFFHNYLANKYPESFDAAVPADLVYSGNIKLTDKVENSSIDAVNWFYLQQERMRRL